MPSEDDVGTSKRQERPRNQVRRMKRASPDILALSTFELRSNRDTGFGSMLIFLPTHRIGLPISISRRGDHQALHSVLSKNATCFSCQELRALPSMS